MENKSELYKVLAAKVEYHNKIKGDTEREQFYIRNTEFIEHLTKNFLPSGGGIDTGCTVNLELSNENKLVINFSYHFMNDNGYYDGWIDYVLIIRPSLADGFTMRIVGKNRNDIKDYLYETFHYCLSQLVDRY
jgi:hypothetical protein